AADTRVALDQLVALGEARMTAREKEAVEDRSATIAERHRRMRAEWKRAARASYRAGKLDAWSVGHVLDGQWNDGMSWVNGTASGWDVLLKTVGISKPGTYLGNPSGHLGFTLGAAYGVAMAHRRYVDVSDMGSYKVG